MLIVNPVAATDSRDISRLAAALQLLNPENSKRVDPRVNFAISTHRQPVGVNHLGFQVDTDCGFLPKGEVPKPDSAGLYVGYQVEDIFGSVRTSTGAADHLGELQAWDLNTGKRVWQHNFKTILWEPLLVTGGDTVFAGGTPDREFRAFDARTGDQLWSFPVPAGVIGVPTSFEVDGEQYIAVTAG